MKEGLVIGGGIVVAGVFVGYVAYTIVKKKPKLLKNTRKKISNIVKKTSTFASEAKQAFAEGFKGAQPKTSKPKVATA
ncbi:MAG: hypothetical protein FVQ84_21270 [Planctomycetes bacterium]|nr:hypothetical protein [Planctomycetota bacterium]